MEQRGPSSKHTPCVLAVRLPSAIVLSNSLKKVASSYIYVCQERSSSETNDRAPRTLKKNPRFMREKKRIKEKKEKKEGKASRTN